MKSFGVIFDPDKSVIIVKGHLGVIQRSFYGSAVKATGFETFSCFIFIQFKISKIGYF